MLPAIDTKKRSLITLADWIKSKINKLIVSFTSENDFLLSCTDLRYLQHELARLKELYPQHYEEATAAFSDFLTFLEQYSVISDIVGDIGNIFETTFDESKRSFFLELFEIILRYRSFFYRYAYPYEFIFVLRDTVVNSRIIAAEGATIVLGCMSISIADIAKIKFIWKKFLAEGVCCLPLRQNPFIQAIGDDAERLIELADDLPTVKRDLLSILDALLLNIPSTDILLAEVSPDTLQQSIALMQSLTVPTDLTSQADINCVLELDAEIRRLGRSLVDQYSAVEAFCVETISVIDRATAQVVDLMLSNFVLFSSQGLVELSATLYCTGVLHEEIRVERGQLVGYFKDIKDHVVSAMAMNASRQRARATM